ncbi:MAG TPA: choice-of-anchor tandem repeat GloVer-containing protein [Verrucomicrobiae bacterium]|jgi:uncharacterized repeat protein (TIGR03803 family)|nr:choice-of-anchor tandem repeat GloVer-containing protein [Verrucomicrobiae bacterium]
MKRSDFFASILTKTSRIALACLGFVLAPMLPAQTFTNLHSFLPTAGNETNADGYLLYSGLVLSGDTLYGTVAHGGTNGNGTAFSINTSGSNFTVLHVFSAASGTLFPLTNSDGAAPRATLLLSGNVLYGTASGGGTNGEGAVFSLNTSGSNFTTIYNFSALSNSISNSDGAMPQSPLALSGGTLYGTTLSGGSAGTGTIFAVNTNGTSFTNLHNFSKITSSTNNDGGLIAAGLVVSGNMLYGAANSGAPDGRGSLFSLTTNGTNFTLLHIFSAVQGVDRTNSDGADPAATLVLSGNTLYGAADSGGTNGNGVLFSINTNGTAFTNFYTFSEGGDFENGDGENPETALILSDSALYGTTIYGGAYSYGTIFTVKTNGMNFTNLHNFTTEQGSRDTNLDGAHPYGSLVLSGGTLYGTTEEGGTGGSGTLFSITLPQPELPIINSISLSGTNLIINAVNGKSGVPYITLMSASLALPLNQWTPIATNTLTASGAFTITATNAVNPIAPERFYILQMR